MRNKTLILALCLTFLVPPSSVAQEGRGPLKEILSGEEFTLLKRFHNLLKENFETSTEELQNYLILKRKERRQTLDISEVIDNFTALSKAERIELLRRGILTLESSIDAQSDTEKLRLLEELEEVLANIPPPPRHRGRGNSRGHHQNQRTRNKNRER